MTFPVTSLIQEALKGMGVFFEEISCSAEDLKVTVTLFREQDALAVACEFSQAGWIAQAEGCRVLAWVGAC